MVIRLFYGCPLPLVVLFFISSVKLCRLVHGVFVCVFFFSLLHKGAIHTGTGASSINKFLTTLNIPCPAEQTLKKRERESGDFVERAAKKACTEAIREERRLATGIIMTTAANVKQPSQGKTVMVSTTDNIDACLACKSALLGVILHTCKTCKRKQHHMCQTEDEQGCVCSSWFHRQTAAASSGSCVSIVASLVLVGRREAQARTTTAWVVLVICLETVLANFLHTLPDKNSAVCVMWV